MEWCQPDRQANPRPNQAPDARDVIEDIGCSTHTPANPLSRQARIDSAYAPDRLYSQQYSRPLGHPPRGTPRRRNWCPRDCRRRPDHPIAVDRQATTATKPLWWSADRSCAPRSSPAECYLAVTGWAAISVDCWGRRYAADFEGLIRERGWMVRLS